MATYLDFASDEEQALSLTSYLARLSKDSGELESQLTSLLKGNDVTGFWKKFLESSSVLFTSETPEKDLEVLFMGMASLFKKAGAATVRVVVPILINVVTTTNPEKATLLRLKILTNTYNILGDVSPQDRYELFMAILNYTVKVNKSETMIPFLSQNLLDNRIAEWKLDAQQKSKVYRLTREIYKQNKKNDEAYEWTIRYLTTLEDPLSADAKQMALTAVRDALAASDVFEFDRLMEIPSVKDLESSNKDLFELLKIFVSGNLESFRNFVGKSPNCLQANGLDSEAATTKIRLLSLASLAVNSQEISYATVAQALQVNEDEVEAWIISAISEKILQARMDQLRNVVVVNGAMKRNFGKEEWTSLDNSLKVWSQSVKSLLATLNKAKTLQVEQPSH
eukprot:TRINITY_DN1266_c0_g1_i1.p1 TRINITY_DN1266_c0_g1~~TRINITY_DN1266_c0_g1_i1.p1  ORF type:complete len:420 (+),score=167.67 TRINITY_DN1266_c0_g1_i1:78-1262(+)